MSVLVACGGGGGQVPDAALAAEDAAANADAATDAAMAYPALGVYVINVDGTGLTLLTDAGTRHMSHVRSLPNAAGKVSTTSLSSFEMYP